jgi:Zn finger protein HypA/HybF involved in hydrogenase expression
MIKEVVKVYIDELNENHLGDFVRCNDCGCLMLMQLGGTTCGDCESENLEWADERQEVTLEELEVEGYIIEIQ